MLDMVSMDIAIELFSGMERYKLVKLNPFKINCRCPLCGDSHKSKRKARFWCNDKKNSLMVGCFNCGYSNYFIPFLKDNYPEYFKKYLFESRKQKIFESKPNVVSKPVVPDIPKIESLNFSHRIDLLDPRHPIVKYVASRAIPKDVWHLLWFTTQWQELANSVSPGTYPITQNENRLVIPIKDFNNNITTIQGRSLDPNNTIRYMTIKSSDDSNKVFGLERVNIKNNIYIFEGPIDSLFINNSLALTGGSLDFDLIPVPKEKRIFIWDNEPRNPDTCKRIETAIKANEKIILFDKLDVTGKDINDIILNDKLTSKQLEEYFEKNILIGLMAQIRFNKWKKC